MEFLGQEYWSVLLCPFPGDLPDPGSEPVAPILQAVSLSLNQQGKPYRVEVKGKSLERVGVVFMSYLTPDNRQLVFPSCPQSNCQPLRSWWVCHLAC